MALRIGIKMGQVPEQGIQEIPKANVAKPMSLF